MTINENPSGLPEQEPTSPTAVVLCDGSKEWWLDGKLHRTDGPAVEYADGSKEWWLDGKLHRTDGPAIEDADGSKEWWLDGVPHRTDGPAIEWASGAKAWYMDGRQVAEAEHAKQVFADDLVTVKWKSGDSDEKLAELLRVAGMYGAHAVIERGGVTHSGPVRYDITSDPYLALGGATDPYRVWFCYPDRSITVTAPKPVDPTSGDPVAEASVVGDATRRVFFRAEDGKWVTGRDCKFGVWTTENLIDVKRLSAETIAELMGEKK